MTAPAEDPRGGMGRHRAPPPPAKPPDRFTAPIAAAAVLLTAASLIAIYAPGIAPDASAATGNGLAVSTAAKSARTVHVPLTVLPAPVPSIGAEGAWDPEATPSAPAGAPQTRPVALGDPTAPFAGAEVSTGAATTPFEAPTGQTVTEDETTTDDTTPTSPADETAAITSSAPTSTEETTPVTETVEPTEPTATVDVTAEVTGP